jgi:hypothetical protein
MRAGRGGARLAIGNEFQRKNHQKFAIRKIQVADSYGAYVEF